MSGKSSVNAGLLGEWKAMRLLRRKGMKMLAWRYRGAGGEADLIMRDKETCVFVEVKYRPEGHIGDGMFAVNQLKQRRIRQAAAHFMAVRRPGKMPVRFDVVEITRAGVRHVRNAF